jgi:2-polyprenyl-6-methoxyphenol hydroxylase-like FAD-dependent oxidoreductase
VTDPILIVGAGPTGLTAALELRRFGVPVRVIDQALDPSTTSRALGIQARTMELLEQRHLIDEILRLGNAAGFGSIYGDGKRLVRIDFGTVHSRYNYLMMLSQAETERILREAIAGLGVEVEWGTKMVGFTQDTLARSNNKVQATLRNKTGAYETIGVPWLISAEGTHSTVRTTLNMDFAGMTVPKQYMLGDVRVDGDLPPTDFHIFGSEHGFMALFPLAEGHFRLIADNPIHGRHDGNPTLEEIQEIYDQRAAVPARFHDMTWSSWFTINSRMVHHLRMGNLLLGGDAAHIHAPAGAQGMNTGMQDMINLCWKLALHIQGKAPLELVETYGRERIPVIQNVLRGTERINDMIGAQDHAFRAVFEHIAPIVGGIRAVQSHTANHMAQIDFGYHDSPLSENHRSHGSVKAGDRIPELTVRHRGSDWATTRLLRLLDPYGFVLLVAHGLEGARLDTRLADAVSGASVPVQIVEMAPSPGDEGEGYAHLVGGRGDVFLVRPDGYVAVAASASAAPNALRAWCAKWLVTPKASAPTALPTQDIARH